MIRQERSADLINLISNLPGVRENICYRPEAMDWAAAFPSDQTGIVILSNGKDACGVFVATGPREWQVHTIFAPTCRGRQAIAAAREMLEWMRPYAERIWGATPIRNCAARWFNRKLGAMPECRDLYAVEGEVEVFSLELSAWSPPRLPQQE